MVLDALMLDALKVERAAGGPAHHEGDARLLRGLHVRLQGRGEPLGALRHGCGSPGPGASDQWQVSSSSSLFLHHSYS